ncbi:hypothetical protein H8B13_03745 [Hymenobacter sp. BT188]|uniref:hypothetical protein n=1 Tax=Hymenobacter sp. BT188 TaxID=2763504 RepID=UPI0016518323|nr:hypothetical protein [Hymenobacter sp. BT188]MBC6605922.1 hypothetical protein [Hymenobacter sp. BT188]
MKRVLYSVFASLILLGGACTPESVEPQPEFFVKANKDGTAWLVPGSGVYNKAQGEFYVFGEQRDGSVRQAYLRLGFNVPSEQPLPTVAQAPSLALLPSTLMVVVGGDVLVDGYTADSLSGTQLLITRLDTIQKVVEGTFTTSLRRDARWSQQGEIIRFTEGSFRVRYR